MSNPTTRLLHLLWLTLLLNPTTPALLAKPPKKAQTTTQLRQRIAQKQKQDETDNHLLPYGAIALGGIIAASVLYYGIANRQPNGQKTGTKTGTGIQTGTGTNTINTPLNNTNTTNNNNTGHTKPNTSDSNDSLKGVGQEPSITPQEENILIYQVQTDRVKTYLPKLVEKTINGLTTIPNDAKQLEQEGIQHFKNERPIADLNKWKGKKYLYQALSDPDSFVYKDKKTWQVAIAKDRDFVCGVGLAWKEVRGDHILVACCATIEKTNSDFASHQFPLVLSLQKAKEALQNADIDSDIFTDNDSA